MDVSWTDLELVWSEAVIRLHGTLDIYVRTASKYDDGHLLHLPHLSFQIKMDWICLANPKVRQPLFRIVSDSEPHSFCPWDTDPASECRSGSASNNVTIAESRTVL